MSKDDSYMVSSKVSKDCQKKLKIIAIEKEITLGELINEILEKFVSKKQLANVVSTNE